MADEVHKEESLVQGIDEENIATFTPAFLTYPREIELQGERFLFQNANYYVLEPSIKNAIAYELTEINSLIHQEEYTIAFERLNTFFQVLPYYKNALQMMVLLCDTMGKSDMAVFYQQRLQRMQQLSRP